MKKGYLRIALSVIIFISWGMFLETNPDENIKSVPIRLLLIAICLIPVGISALLLQSGIAAHRASHNKQHEFKLKFGPKNWALLGLGTVLCALQFMSIMGSLKTDSLHFFENVTNIEVFFFDLLYFLGYNLCGIIGIVLIIVGLPKRIHK